MLKAILPQLFLVLILLASPLYNSQFQLDLTQRAAGGGNQNSGSTSSTPNFALTVYPLAQTVYIGSKVTYSVSLRSMNSFTGLVALKIENLSAALLLITGFNPETVGLSINSRANSTLTVDALNAGEENFTEFLVVASSGNLTSRVDVQITILAGGMPPTPISYAFLGSVLLFSAFIIWYGLRSRRLHQRRENLPEGPKPPPV